MYSFSPRLRSGWFNMGLERKVGGSDALLYGRLSLFTPTLNARGSVGTQQLVWRFGFTRVPSTILQCFITRKTRPKVACLLSGYCKTNFTCGDSIRDLPMFWWFLVANFHTESIYIWILIIIHVTYASTTCIKRLHDSQWEIFATGMKFFTCQYKTVYSTSL